MLLYRTIAMSVVSWVSLGWMSLRWLWLFLSVTLLIVVRLSVIILGASLLSIVAPLKLRLMLASKSKTNPNHSLSLSHNSWKDCQWASTLAYFFRRMRDEKETNVDTWLKFRLHFELDKSKTRTRTMSLKLFFLRHWRYCTKWGCVFITRNFFRQV